MGEKSILVEQLQPANDLCPRIVKAIACDNKIIGLFPDGHSEIVAELIVPQLLTEEDQPKRRGRKPKEMTVMKPRRVGKQRETTTSEQAPMLNGGEAAEGRVEA